MADTTPSIENIVIIFDPDEKNRETHLLTERSIINFGNIFAWLFPPLIGAIIAQVLLRKMGNNQAWLDDALWMGFAVVGILILASFILTRRRAHQGA